MPVVSVAPQTIYAHFGSKASVLTGLVDLMDEEAGFPLLMAKSAELTDPVELLGLLVRSGTVAATSSRC